MRRFTKINESFTCARCGAVVPPAGRTCRNHCPFCLTSKHVDVNPGDRQADCQGLMPAVDYDVDGKKGLILVFRCERCAAEKRNIALLDDSVASDDYDLILALKSPW